MAVFGVANNNDEIKKYQFGGYIVSNEAVWRILIFSTYDRHPRVCISRSTLRMGSVSTLQRTMPFKEPITPKIQLWQRSSDFSGITTSPEHSFTRNFQSFALGIAKKKQFCRRKQGAPFSGKDTRESEAIGRVCTVHPNNTECFYLQMLLFIVRGPTLFENSRIVSGELCSTYRPFWQRVRRQTQRHLGRIQRRFDWRFFEECTESNNDSKLSFPHLIYYRALVVLEDKSISMISKTAPQLGH